MFIKNLKATFGCLDGQEMSLKPGLNVISGENESGKSTWSAFLRTMLYGVSTREQSRGGFMADKEKYLPWSGKPMYGKLEIEENGKNIEIERAHTKGGIFGDSEMKYSPDGEPVENPLSQQPGEMFFGVSREVFERSAFIGQARISIDDDKKGELSRRIISIAGSGEENTSYKTAAARLSEWKNRRKRSSSGTIDTLTAQGESISERLGSMRQTAHELTEKSAKINTLTREKDVLAGYKRTWQALRSWEQVSLKTNSDVYTQEAEELLQVAKSNLAFRNGFVPTEEYCEELSEAYRAMLAGKKLVKESDAVEVLRRTLALDRVKLAEYSDFAGMTAAQAMQAAKGETKYARDINDRWARGKKIVMWIGIFAFAAIFAAVAYAVYAFTVANGVSESITKLVTLGIVSGAIFVFCAALLIYAGNTLVWKRQLSYAMDDVEMIERATVYGEILSKIHRSEELLNASEGDFKRSTHTLEALSQKVLEIVHRSNPEGVADDVPMLLSLCKERLIKYRAAERELEAARIRAGAISEGRDIEQMQKNSEGITSDTPKPPYSEQEVAKKLAEVEDAIYKLELSKRELQARIDIEGSISEAEESMERLRESIDVQQLELEAICCAIEELEGANAELTRKFSPEIEGRAAELFSRLTGGRFKVVSISGSDMSMKVAKNEFEAKRDILSLSAGTLDELYLSIRIALSEKVLNRKTPLILDDALVNFDDSRMEKALSLLCELAKERQIILFSCHARERTFAENRGEINIIEL